MYPTRPKMVTNGDMSASINSVGIILDQIPLASIHAVWTGSPVGTLKLQVSNDLVKIPVSGSADMAANVVNWTDYTGSSQAVSGAGDFMFNLLSNGYYWIRLVYTRSSGTGTLNVTFSGKGI